MAGLCPDAERDAIVSMLAARPEAEYQLAREPERLAAILARTRQNGYGENFRGWRQEEKIASIAVPVCSQQRVIGCLNTVYIASAMTIEQAAQKHLPCTAEGGEADRSPHGRGRSVVRNALIAMRINAIAHCARLRYII